MDTDATSTIEIAPHLKLIQDERSSGELVVFSERNPSVHYYLYFYLGRLVYATGGSHRVRRFYRSLRQNCPNAKLDEWLTKFGEPSEPWEFFIVNQALKQGLIEQEKAKMLVLGCIQEVFYAVISRQELVTTWTENRHPQQPFVLVSSQQILQGALQARQKWLDAGLGHVQNMIPGFSLNFVPVILAPDRLKAMVAAEALSTEAHQMLVKLLNGNNTIWDLSIRMHRSHISVMRSLLPLVIDGIVALREAPDLPSPVAPQVEAEPETKKGLIACIDDSPQIGMEMTRILNKAGYEVLNILDPLQGVSTLLKNKPDLIFLDLVMPNSNGYELCSFLRKTSAFREVPIVILTGHDGVIDRVRAKMAGSSDFLSKPPEEAKVVQIVEKYLESS
ncbi:response regulator [Tumidithrix elongata RA019]|uniref:Response regulator n=1 Tax=Tumidithrix elongata BACA0141 TaxID=2716417 RepID=A0AAW9PUF8_9CYAN|nr:response regulator [Tumidithrix elongata RA019]